jgi:hypothetical protein
VAMRRQKGMKAEVPRASLSIVTAQKSTRHTKDVAH